MMRWLILALICLFPALARADAFSNTQPPSTSTPIGTTTLGAIANSTSPRAIGLSAWQNNTENNFGTLATNLPGETTRVLYTTKGGISRLSLFLPTQTASSGQEIAAYNPVLYTATVEYPLGANATPPQFTLAGQSTMVVGTAGSGVLSDGLGIAIPPNTQFAIRYGTFVATPPPSIGLGSSTTGGTLAAATYFYTATCTISGVESGATAEVNTTTTGATSSVTVTAATPTNPLGCNSIKIYRSTTTGTETYLATLPGPGLVYVDTGAATTPGNAAPATQKYSFGGHLEASQSTTGCSGSHLNSVVGTGALTTAGPNSCFINAPMPVGDDVSSYPVCGVGDSIQAGSGIQAANVSTPGGLDSRDGNWFAQGLPQGTFNSLNLSLPSSQVRSFASTGFYGAALRTRAIDFCGYVVSDLGTNDIYAAVTWQNTALAHIQFAQSLAGRGKAYYITTLLPRGASTDNMILAANYTIGAQEAARVNYNTWVRNGMQVSANTPVLTGGTPTPYIAGYFDLAAALPESNVANVPTQNGGYWPMPAAPYGTATVAAGSTGNNINYANWSGGATTNFIMVGMVVKITSGTASGQTCIVSVGNTSSTIFCGSGVTTASLSVGDTLSVYQTIGFDGIHPSFFGHTGIASGAGGFAAWALTNLNPR